MFFDYLSVSSCQGTSLPPPTHKGRQDSYGCALTPQGDTRYLNIFQREALRSKSQNDIGSRPNCVRMAHNRNVFSGRPHTTYPTSIM